MIGMVIDIGPKFNVVLPHPLLDLTVKVMDLEFPFIVLLKVFRTSLFMTGMMIDISPKFNAIPPLYLTSGSRSRTKNFYIKVLR